MEKITLPSKVTYRKDVQDERQATLTVEPLFPGYGVTVGNALRRVLLSSLPGAAITAFRIAGVPHEFSTLEHVKEDVIEMMLNLKQVRFMSHAKEPVIVKLSVKGERAVTAGDIAATADVTIINPTHHLCTLTDKDARLDMELIVDRGRGYVTVEEREQEKLDIGWIAVDAIYSPIEKINFDVEAARVGQITNFDKLTMHITTDGTITPKEAIERSAHILVDHFRLLATELVLADGEEDTVRSSLPTEDVVTLPEPALVTPASGVSAEPLADGTPPASPSGTALIEELELSTRTINALYNNDVKTVDDIAKLTEEELADLQGLGGKAVSEVKKALKKLGVTLTTSAGTPS